MENQEFKNEMKTISLIKLYELGKISSGLENELESDLKIHKIISNTTPILSLLKIDKLDLLKELFGKITIPNAVFQEIEKDKKNHIIKI